MSNTSPIINLAAIGHLHLLHDLFGEILILQAVYDEIAVRGKGKPGAAAVAAYDGFRVVPVQDLALTHAFLADVHAGEAEALALAIEVKAEVLLIDERRGRAIAKRFGIPHAGLLAVLEEAKREAIIPSVRPLLDALQNHAGFWISTQLRKHVLDRVRE